MARSRESVRENKAMQSILRGETPEKRIFIATEDKEFKEKMKLEKKFGKTAKNLDKHLTKLIKGIDSEFKKAEKE